jgi:hypothetical protein
MDLDRRNAPIPRLPGKSGPPVPYNPIDAAKYDAVMAHAKRDPEGNLLGKAEGGGFDRDWGMTLKNVLLGASAAAAGARPGEDPLGRAIGGAFTAGVGSTINPEAGHEFGFDVGQRPKLEAEIGRARAEQDRQRIERAAAMDEALKQGQVNRIPLDLEAERAKIEGTRAATEIARRNANRQDALTQSQIELNKARAVAAETGRPQKVDRVNQATGEIETVFVYPNGDELLIGGSAAAKISHERNESAERRVSAQQAGATGRTAMSQAGANSRSAASIAGAKERTEMRINAAADQGGQANQSKLRNPSSGGQGAKTATMEKLREFYGKRGITDDAEIRRRATQFGITVKDKD